MATAETTEVFDCSVADFYKIITDYAKYPEFLSEVKECKLVKVEGNRKLVEYSISLIKTFTYSLWMTENGEDKVEWALASGNLFKESSGYWHLEDEAGKCRATYHVSAKFNVFVPGPVAKALVNVNLPTMMSSYHKRVQELYGK
jgi:ribosome-associated toxin RatA of RatAB toxin-antitoxin module